MQIGLNFDPNLLETYEQRNSPLLFDIYWTHNDISYPSADWLDFGGVILGWWLVVLKKLKQGENESEFLFMDGPYSIEIKYYKQEDKVELILKGTDIMWELSFQELTDIVISASNRTCQYLERLGVGEEYQLDLKMGIEMLK